MLKSSTPPRWFEAASRSLAGLLSDHFHCERKAAETALSLVRRYPSDVELVERLSRLAHEETAHLVQVSVLLAERGLALRADTPNLWARRLLELARPREPHHRTDLLLIAALIEARSHERLFHLAHGFAGIGDDRLADFYAALGGAEERHAALYVELAERGEGREAVAARLDELAFEEARILAALPFGPRVH
jgi:tRNA 2-(methylsulfanyl)-N6-isopentenyladenosine37 hydroxylase